MASRLRAQQLGGPWHHWWGLMVVRIILAAAIPAYSKSDLVFPTYITGSGLIRTCPLCWSFANSVRVTVNLRVLTDFAVMPCMFWPPFYILSVTVLHCLGPPCIFFLVGFFCLLPLVLRFTCLVLVIFITFSCLLPLRCLCLFISLSL